VLARSAAHAAEAEGSRLSGEHAQVAMGAPDYDSRLSGEHAQVAVRAPDYAHAAVSEQDERVKSARKEQKLPCGLPSN